MCPTPDVGGGGERLRRPTERGFSGARARARWGWGFAGVFYAYVKLKEQEVRATPDRPFSPSSRRVGGGGFQGAGRAWVEG